jgi:putative endonuclease
VNICSATLITGPVPVVQGTIAGSPRAKDFARRMAGDRPGHEGEWVRQQKGYVYILASRRNGTLYVGVTRNPSRRWFEHLHSLTPGFTSRYGVTRLVWIERHELLVSAIQREKSIEKYRRAWKLNLIEASNPNWDDLSATLMDA